VTGKMETVLRKNLFKAQFLEQEAVVDQGLLGSAISYRRQVYHWGSCSTRQVTEENGMSLSMMPLTLGLKIAERERKTSNNNA